MGKKYIEIAERIRGEIDSGQYPPGTNIPSIRALAAAYGANPQTVNKATAYLASIGYLEARVGAGSTVRKPAPEPERRRLPMLIDRFRARLLEDLNDVANYHGKDIYLSYLIRTAATGRISSFIVYDPEEEKPPSGFEREIREAEGVLVQGTLPRARLDMLAREDVPTVLINRAAPDGDQGRMASVLIPEDKIADLVNLLGSLGHTSLLFAFSDRFARSSVLDDRYLAARRAWESRGMDPGTLRMFVYTEGSGEHARLLREAVSSGFTAAVSYNDVSALGLYGLATGAGLRLPEDFSVVGFDDIAMAQLSSPSLTTIHVDRMDLVSRCFDLLCALEAGAAPLRLLSTVRTDLVIRQSAFRAP